MHALVWRVSQFEDLPPELRAYIEEQAPMWRDAPKDLEEIKRLQKEGGGGGGGGGEEGGGAGEGENGSRGDVDGGGGGEKDEVDLWADNEIKA